MKKQTHNMEGKLRQEVYIFKKSYSNIAHENLINKIAKTSGMKNKIKIKYQF